MSISGSRIITGKTILKNIATLHRFKFDFNLSSMCARKEIFTDRVLNYILNNLQVSPDTLLAVVAISSSKDIYLTSEEFVGYRQNYSSSKIVEHNKESLQHLLNFWDKLLFAYRDYLTIANLAANQYIWIRLYSQAIAIRILLRKHKLRTDKEYAARYPLRNCISQSLKTKDLILLFDSFRLLKEIIFRRTPNNSS